MGLDQPQLAGGTSSGTVTSPLPRHALLLPLLSSPPPIQIFTQALTSQAVSKPSDSWVFGRQGPSLPACLPALGEGWQEEEGRGGAGYSIRRQEDKPV
jgi:hypothetical protein